MNPSNPLSSLKASGQALWCDGLSRGLVLSGELKRMIEEYGVTGVLFNPAVFERAITGTNQYDREIGRLASEGLGEGDIAARLMTEDALLAAEVLSGVYRETSGGDGFVSMELPLDAGAWLEALTGGWETRSICGAPNIMIRVSVKGGGPKEIEDLTRRGLNVNAAGIFSGGTYAEIALAYLRGLKARLSDGNPIDGVAGMASFFIGPVDSFADKLIMDEAHRRGSRDERARLKSLLGRVAISNAALALLRFGEIFASREFKRLKDEGGRELKLVWVSTGSRDPGYRELKYAEGLIAAGTVNAMPLDTIVSFLDHGRCEGRLLDRAKEAGEVFSELASLGVDFEALRLRLEDECARRTLESYAKIKECIKEKVRKMSEKKDSNVRFALGPFEGEAASALERMEAGEFLKRLWAKDAALWNDTPEHRKIIKNALGWLSLPERMEEGIGPVTAFAEEVREAGFKRVVLLGMGGSSLAPLVLVKTFGARDGYPELVVVDSTDPGAVREAGSLIAESIFIVASKSGTTIEPMSLFEHYYGRLKEIKGEGAGAHFIAITDPGTMLEGLSKKCGFRRCFINPPDIGGRFSALSYFGLVPSALAGVDIRALLDGAACLSESVKPGARAAGNPTLMLGASMGVLARAGRDKLTFFLPKGLETFGLWLEQLIAESTGKEGVGIVPVTGEAPAEPESYGPDRAFVGITLGEAGDEGLLKRLAEAGHPVMSVRLDSRMEIGAEFFRWEVATAAAGHVMGIDPFDQPDVELAKRLTIDRLGSGSGDTGPVPPGIKAAGPGIEVYIGRAAAEAIGGVDKKSGAAALKDFFGLLKKGDYIGVMAYYNTLDDALGGVLDGLRSSIRDSTRCATQFGFGPRYLHSTGQLHKGGANKGLFVIVCHRSPEDAGIPGANYTFSTLELSQAFGDMEALDSKGMRVALVCAPDGAKKGLEGICAAIEKAAAGESACA